MFVPHRSQFSDVAADTGSVDSIIRNCTRCVLHPTVARNAHVSSDARIITLLKHIQKDTLYSIHRIQTSRLCPDRCTSTPHPWCCCLSSWSLCVQLCDWILLQASIAIPLDPRPAPIPFTCIVVGLHAAFARHVTFPSPFHFTQLPNSTLHTRTPFTSLNLTRIGKLESCPASLCAF